MTTTKTYCNNKTGQTVEIRGDFDNSSSPIEVRFDGGVWQSTPFQVADARHYWAEALRLVLGWGE